jgi:hypothetical protein
MDKVIDNVLIPQRLEGESFEDYKVRRREGNLVSKAFRHGAPKLFWESRTRIVKTDKEGKEHVSYLGNTFRKQKEQLV